jgi:hypothetical protein
MSYPSASRASHKKLISHEFLQYRTTRTMRKNKGGRATAEEQGQAGITNCITNQMPATRSGTKYTVGPEHHGRYAYQKMAYFQTRKNARILDPATCNEISDEKGSCLELPHLLLQQGTKLSRWKGLATRGTNPTCLYFGLDRCHEDRRCGVSRPCTDASIYG